MFLYGLLQWLLSNNINNLNSNNKWILNNNNDNNNNNNNNNENNNINNANGNNKWILNNNNNDNNNNNNNNNNKKCILFNSANISERFPESTHISQRRLEFFPVKIVRKLVCFCITKIRLREISSSKKV